MYTGEGDGGDTYDLLTFNKSGRRIAMLEAAWQQGEESEWIYNQTAVLTGFNLNIRATVCHRLDSINYACDTINRYYQFKENGEIVLLKKDTLFNPVLNSIRIASPYN